MFGDPIPDELRKAQRPYEVFEFIAINEPWMRCQHGKHIVEVRAHWSDDAPFTVTTGRINHTQTYPHWVHSDGTRVLDSDGRGVFEYNVVSQCPKCGDLNTLTVKQEAYGDRTTCTNCGYNNWYSIGD